MRSRAAVIVLALLALAQSTWAAGPDLPWVGSEKAAVAAARESSKPLLLFLRSDYCVWCKKMEQTTFRDSRVRLLAEQYVLCRLDGEREGKPLIARYKVQRYPYQAFVDLDGGVLFAAPDYQDPDQYARLLAQHLPADRLALLEKSADPRVRAALAIARAERDEVEAAASLRASLAAGSPPADALGAVDAALGRALLRKGDASAAAPLVQSAVAASADPREAVQLRLVLVQCLAKSGKNAEALAELDALEKTRGVNGDEKKQIKDQRKTLR